MENIRAPRPRRETMFRFSLISIALTFCLTSFASEAPNAFSKRFSVVKKEGKSTLIRDRSLSFRFSIAPYVKMIKEQLKNEQALMAAKGGDYEADIVDMLEQADLEKNAQNGENIAYVVESLRALESVDIDAVFSDPAFNKVVTGFESKISEALLTLDPTVVANLDNPTFFYNQRVTYQALTWGLGLAKKLLSSVPLLNTASYVLVQVEKLVREQRLYHQFMLLHYLENYDAEALGLTHDEANRAFSSVMESKIPWFAFWESQAARADWQKYGTSRFFQNTRTANNRFRSYRTEYSTIGKRLNFAFVEVEKEGERQILNLFDSQNMFSSRPSIAFYPDAPMKIVRNRVVLQLAELGLSFISLPSWLKDGVEGYLKSHYDAHRFTEGALYAYLENAGDGSRLNQIHTQFLNPFSRP
jgi:hypothetical protein